MNTSAAENQFETEIAQLLGELSNVQDELLEVLSAKRDLMARGDAQGMAQLQPREEQLCERLEACHQHRAELLQTAGRNGLPNGSLGKLVAQLSSGNRDKLTRQVQHASARMRLLQHHSLTNWVLAQRSILHLSQMLEIIATGGRLQPTYGRGDSTMSSGALVDREA